MVRMRVHHPWGKSPKEGSTLTEAALFSNPEPSLTHAHVRRQRCAGP